MADVAAKDGSQVCLMSSAPPVWLTGVHVQETVVNLAALLINLVLTPLVAGKTE